jgi:hypothetical protein
MTMKTGHLLLLHTRSVHAATEAAGHSVKERIARVLLARALQCTTHALGIDS